MGRIVSLDWPRKGSVEVTICRATSRRCDCRGRIRVCHSKLLRSMGLLMQEDPYTVPHRYCTLHHVASIYNIMCLEIMRHEMYKSITNDIDTTPILVLDHSRWCFLSCTANAESNPCDDLPSWTHKWPPLPAQLRLGFACCVAPMFWTLTPLFWYSDVQVCD